jgi:predicted ester cyclase
VKTDNDKSETLLNTNIEVVREFYEAMNGHDPAAFDSILAEDWLNDPLHPNQPAGRAGWRPAVQGLFTAFPDLVIEIESVVAQNDRVMARIVLEGDSSRRIHGKSTDGKIGQDSELRRIRSAPGTNNANLALGRLARRARPNWSTSTSIW